MTARPFDTHEKIERPEYCECLISPWSTRRGPLKDGSHYSNCVAGEVAEDMAVLVRDRDRWRDEAVRLQAELDTWGSCVDMANEIDALRSVVRHSQVVDCYAEDGHDWTPVEEAAIRAALEVDQ